MRDTLKRAAELAKTDPRAAYALILGDTAELAEAHPELAYETMLRQAAATELIKELRDPQWKLTHDWGQLLAEFKTPDKTTLTVTFEDVDDVIFGSQRGGEASISYTAGRDEKGNWLGQQGARRSYQTRDDIRQILQGAERLWKRWK